MDDDSPDNRETVRNSLANQIEFIDDRIDTIRAENTADDENLIRWIRAQAYVAGQYRKLKNDQDLEEMEEDLELLKDVTGAEDNL